MKDKFALFRSGFEGTLRKENKSLTFDLNADGEYVDERVKAEWDKYVKDFKAASVGSGRREQKKPYRQESRQKPQGQKPTHVQRERPVKKEPKTIGGKTNLNTLNQAFEDYCRDFMPDLDLTRSSTNHYVSRETMMQWTTFRRAYQQHANWLRNSANDRGPWIVSKIPYTKEERDLLTPDQLKKDFAFARKPYYHNDRQLAIAEAQKLADERRRPFLVWNLSQQVVPTPIPQLQVADAESEPVTTGDPVMAARLKVINMLRDEAAAISVKSKRISLLALGILGKMVADGSEDMVKQICGYLSRVETVNNVINLAMLSGRNDIPSELFMIHAADREIEMSMVIDTAVTDEETAPSEEAAEDTKFSLQA